MSLKGMHGRTTVSRYTETLEDGAEFEVVTTRRSELRAINHQAAMPLQLLHHLSFQSQLLLIFRLEHASGFLCEVLSSGGREDGGDDLRPY